VYSLNLEVGSIIIGLYFEKKKIFLHFKEYFDGYYSLNEPDIHIQIKTTEKGRFSEVPNSLFLTKKVKSNRFEAGNGLLKGIHNSKNGEWKFSVHTLILEGEYIRVFEQILYQVFITISKQLDSFLVHSCGVINDGWGYLFVGPSEAGKSTIAGLSQNFHVLNDEINIIDLSTETPTLEGTPFNGLYRVKKMGKAPLKGIFILHKSAFHSVEKITGGKAIKPLANEIIPLIGLKEELSSHTYMEMMDAAKKIYDKVPVYKLNFLPDSGFWKLIKEIK
jgi:hypothetical protein